MSAEYTIPLSKVEQEFNLERITVPENYDEIKVETPQVNRPGLALTGFYEIFEKYTHQRICWKSRRCEAVLLSE